MQSRLVVLLLAAAVLVPMFGQSARAQDRIADNNYYAAYYDGHYGQIADGYWGRKAVFWYKDHSGLWHADDGAHFKREAATGFVLVHGSGIPRVH